VRQVTLADAEAGAELVRALQADCGYRPAVNPSDVRDWLQWGDLEDASWAFEEDGRLLAFGWVFKRGPSADGIGYVHPEARGRGFGTELVGRSEEWTRAAFQGSWGFEPMSFEEWEPRRGSTSAPGCRSRRKT
jgi:GNAT superfamily N-acetyltransferase